MSTIVLWVANLEASVKFYQALFEDKHPYVTDGFASVGSGDNEVLLHLLPEQFRGNASLGEENPIKPIFSVNSLEVAKLAAGRNGGSVSRETQEHESWRYADAKDVDGHVIQLRERI